MKIPAVATAITLVLALAAGTYAVFSHRLDEGMAEKKEVNTVKGSVDLKTASSTAAQRNSDHPEDPSQNTVPAWTNATKTDAQALAENGLSANNPVNAAKKLRMDKALERLQELQKTGSTDPKQVAAAILQVEEANGSPNLQGVRLDLLRQNLEVAEKMRGLAAELSALQPTGKAPQTPEASAALQTKLEQLAALQKQLRTDIVQGSTADAVR